jgi:hypothetical protein
MTVPEEMREHHTHCVPYRVCLRILARDEAAAPLPPGVVHEVGQATSAILAERPSVPRGIDKKLGEVLGGARGVSSRRASRPLADPSAWLPGSRVRGHHRTFTSCPHSFREDEKPHHDRWYARHHVGHEPYEARHRVLAAVRGVAMCAGRTLSPAGTTRTCACGFVTCGTRLQPSSDLRERRLPTLAVVDGKRLCDCPVIAREPAPWRPQDHRDYRPGDGGPGGMAKQAIGFRVWSGARSPGLVRGCEHRAMRIHRIEAIFNRRLIAADLADLPGVTEPQVDDHHLSCAVRGSSTAAGRRLRRSPGSPRCSRHRHE